MAPHRYFVDENLIAVGRALALVRDDVVHPGHPDLLDIPLGAKDPDWLPLVGSEGHDLVVISRDRKIRTKPGERKLFDESGVRAIFLTGSKDMSKWGTFAMLVARWGAMDTKVQKAGKGPWAMSLANNNFKAL